jgi:phosphotriesterase-related protein
MPSDAQRLDVIADLLSQGLADRILISHDICTRHRLVRYGGHGYGRIPAHIVPRMRERGWSEADIDQIVVANPARLLTFVEERADG